MTPLGHQRVYTCKNLTSLFQDNINVSIFRPFRSFDSDLYKVKRQASYRKEIEIYVRTSAITHPLNLAIAMSVMCIRKAPHETPLCVGAQ